MALDVGSVFIRLGAKTDRKGFDDYQREVVRAQKIKDISTRLGADVDERGFAEYERKLAGVREKAKHRESFKATLGADYDGRAFNAWWRDMQKAERQAKDTDRTFAGLTRRLTSLGSDVGRGGFFSGLLRSLGLVAEMGAKVGNAIAGGGGGLVGALGALAGAAAGGVVGLGALLAVISALAGAAIALVGSLGAAAAGLAALGIGAAAAGGPLVALAGAVIARVSAITDAYKAMSAQQTKGGTQAKAVAQQQSAAAQQIKTAEQGVADAQRNVQQAQDNLTQARFKARREVQDLATAVTRAALAEESASLTLASAQERLTKVNLDPNATLLDRLDAQHAVTDASQGATDANRSYARTLTDRARGTDTIRQAQRQLNDAIRAERRAEEQVTQARKAATAATEKQGAAATDAQQKLALLSSTERHLLTTAKGFADALKKMFAPATDAIFGGVNSALQSLEPVLGRFTGRFKGIGTAIGSIIDNAAKSLAGPEWGRALDSFIATSRKIVKPISDTVGSVLVILRNIAVAAQPLVVELANNISKAMGGFATKTQDANKVRDVIHTLVDHTRSWFNLMVSASKVLFTIFSSGASDGKSLVDWLRRILDHWNAFLNTREGQQRLHDFFRNAIDLSKKIFAALGQVVGVLLQISDFFLHIGASLGPAAKFIKDHVKLVEGAIFAWGALKGAIIAANAASVLGSLRGKAAAGAAGAGAAGTGARAGAGVAGAAGVAAAGVIPGLVIMAGATVLFNVLDKSSEKAKAYAGGLKIASDYADKLVKAADPAAMHRFANSLGDLAKQSSDGGAAVHDLQKRLNDNANSLTNWRNKVRDVNRDVRDSFKVMATVTEGHLSDIRRFTERNATDIRNSLKSNTDEGRAALASNFRQAAKAIQQSMDDGKISTKTGTAEIRRLMVQALKSLGLTNSQAVALQDHGTVQSTSSRTPGQGLAPTNARGGWIKRAMGGWIGSRGMVSDDIVQIAPDALAAFGEYDAHGPGGRRAIINRHQAPAVEWALAAGGYPSLDALPSGQQLPAIEQALGPLGGLDELFASITRPHYLATGGYVQGAVPAGGPAAAALAREMFAKGFNVTSAKRNTNTYHGSAGDGLGDALDFGNSVNDLRKVWSVLFPRRASFVELFGPSAFAGLYHGTQKFTDPGLQAGHEDHVHVAIVNKLIGALASAVPKIRAPKVRGTGSVAGMVRRALTLTTRGANARIASAADSQGAVLGGDTLSVGPAVGGNSRSVVTAALRLAGMPANAANVASMLTLLSKENASGNPAAVNPVAVGNEHATGFLQMLPSTFSRYAVRGHTNIRNAVDNAASSARYQVARYGHLVTQSPYARGGMLKRLAKGGYTSKITDTKGTTGGGGAGTLDKLQVTRIADYDKLQGEVTDLITSYGQADRTYNLSDEVLIDPVTGAIDEAAVKKRADEIEKLAGIQRKIIDVYERMRAIAKRVVETYATLIERLSRSLKHVKKGSKREATIIGEISAYQTELGTWQTNVHDLETQKIPDAQLDLSENEKEKASVLGTTATTSTTPGLLTDAQQGQADVLDMNAALAATTPDTADDASAKNALKDFWAGVLKQLQDAGAAPSLITQAANNLASYLTPTSGAASPADIAAAAIQDFGNYLTGAQDLYRNFGNNFTSAGQAGGMFANPDLATATAGPRYFGGASGGYLGGAQGGPVFVIQEGGSVARYDSTPDDPHTQAHQLRYAIENAVG